MHATAEAEDDFSRGFQAFLPNPVTGAHRDKQLLRLPGNLSKNYLCLWSVYLEKAPAPPGLGRGGDILGLPFGEHAGLWSSP